MFKPTLFHEKIKGGRGAKDSQGVMRCKLKIEVSVIALFLYYTRISKLLLAINSIHLNGHSIGFPQ